MLLILAIEFYQDMLSGSHTKTMLPPNLGAPNATSAEDWFEPSLIYFTESSTQSVPANTASRMEAMSLFYELRI